jgi:preprotein translocase subunit SecD
LQQTGLLEFVDFSAVDASQAGALEHTVVTTDFGSSSTGSARGQAAPTAQVTESSQPATASPSPTAATVYHTVMTGADLKNVSVTTDRVGKYQVAFELNAEGAQIFKDFTSKNVGKILAIVLDKKVISAPRIDTAITEGRGVITGNFTYDTANNLAIQLRYGSLPIPLKVATSQTVGPTLGQSSLNKSLIAGLIGLIVVILYMALYYRLPGVVADIALVLYILITLALFKLIPVTLTLPGIAGVILSIGVAVDANILIFERLKEELRSGKTLRQAIDLGWKRAWPSIRDSNLSTLITCTILFWFGSTFGASIVKGFSLTLALGVLVSMFTAIIVTRTFLHLVLDNIQFTEHPAWFGVQE